MHTSLFIPPSETVVNRLWIITNYGVVFIDIVFVSDPYGSVSGLESRWVSSLNHKSLRTVREGIRS